YGLCLVLFAGLRTLAFYVFARQEGAQFVRVSLLQYGLTVALDLLYVGILQMGPKGIPLGFVTSLVLTCALVYRRNVGDLRYVLDRSLGVFSLKALAASAFAAISIAVLRITVSTPNTGVGDFIYLCALCGAGSLIF